MKLRCILTAGAAVVLFAIPAGAEQKFEPTWEYHWQYEKGALESVFAAPPQKPLPSGRNSRRRRCAPPPPGGTTGVAVKRRGGKKKAEKRRELTGLVATELAGRRGDSHLLSVAQLSFDEVVGRVGDCHLRS